MQNNAEVSALSSGLSGMSVNIDWGMMEMHRGTEKL